MVPRSAISPNIHARLAAVSHAAPRVNQFGRTWKYACMKIGMIGTDAVKAAISAIELTQWLEVTTYQKPA